MFRLFSRFNDFKSVAVLLTAAAVLFIPSAAYSQQSSATINGTVKDSSGAVVEGASISAN